MTEAEWLTATDPYRPVEWLFTHHPASDRKSRLFAVACCLRLAKSVSDWPRAKYIGVAEEFADGKIDRVALLEKIDPFDAYDLGLPSPIIHTLRRPFSLEHIAMDYLLMLSCSDASDNSTRSIVADLNDWTFALRHLEMVERDEVHSGLQACVHILRDIFGNPFRPIVADPRWLTSTVVTLAETIYADRAFDRLPILADAFQDAGCEDAELLAHCRGPGPHVRGCWAVDLVLGKT